LGLKDAAIPDLLPVIARAGVYFQSRSSIWTRAHVLVLPTFLEAAKRCCEAELLPLPTQEPVTAINKWVASATKGRIREIVSSVGPNISVILINAAYFRGTWTAQFDPNVTQPGAFSLMNGGTKTVPFMRQVAAFPYKHGSNFDWTRVPYGDGRIVMDLLLPSRNTPPVDFLDTLLTVGDPHARSAPMPATGSLQLPRFTVESAYGLNSTLSSLGLQNLFKLGSADFSRLTSNPAALAVDEVRHSVAISVDESGTEAAAATSITMVGSLPSPAQMFNLRFDHPFLLAIRDSQDGTVLFVALVRDPAGR
jgi:serpin B